MLSNLILPFIAMCDLYPPNFRFKISPSVCFPPIIVKDEGNVSAVVPIIPQLSIYSKYGFINCIVLWNILLKHVPLTFAILQLVKLIPSQFVKLNE